MQNLDQINVYAFLMFKCLCWFNSQTYPGATGVRENFFLPYNCELSYVYMVYLKFQHI